MGGQIRVGRQSLAEMLRSHGEDDLADRVPSLTDDELTRIRTLGAYYAFSQLAVSLGGSMGGTRALSLATIDVLEDTQRDLHRHHTSAEIDFGWAEQPAAAEIARDRSLRANAAREQQPPSRS